MAGLMAIKILLMILAAIVLPVVVIWTLVKVLQGLFWGLGMLGLGIAATLRGVGRGVAGSVRHVGTFARDEVVDTLRFGGGVLTAGVILPLAFLNFCLGRWSSAAHFGRALEDELISSGISLYRVAVGNPVRLFGLGILTEGVERRLPDLMARAPQPRRKTTRPGRFAGYKVTGTLPAGGSGALLYLAKPKPEKLGQLRATGHPDPGQVVIKSFALAAGSTLPQIVRESRALEAAKRMHLVLEHQLSDDSFHYVMPYVPGENLDVVISNMHEHAGPSGLGRDGVGVVIDYARDLLQTLERFHAGGLWHKDIKPGNLIVSGGRVHLVDLGLVTPLRSDLTLTTHGTEYYRDPEMVRLAMKGVKVHEVDGVRFDIYSAGAVLYSMIENSFPAHGSLSILTKECPEALKWIVRRAMAEMNRRYASAGEMLADLRRLASDPYGVQPADLPSVSGRDDWSLRGETVASASGAAPPPPVEPVPLRPVAAPASPPAAKAVRRRTSRALIAAGVWSLFVLGAMGSLVAVTMDQHGAVAIFDSATGSHSPSHERYETARAGGHSHHPEGIDATHSDAASTHEEELDRLESLWAERLGRGRLLGLAEPLPDGPAMEADGRVLVLEDLGPQADREVLEGLRQALATSGFEVLGGRRSTEAGANEIELEARARKAAGLSDPADAAAVRRLEEFLDGEPELDALIWVASSADDELVHYRLILRQEHRTAGAESFDPGAELARRN